MVVQVNTGKYGLNGAKAAESAPLHCHLMLGLAVACPLQGVQGRTENVAEVAGDAKGEE